MNSKAFLWMLAIFVGFCLVIGQAATVSAQDQQKKKPKSSQQKAKEKEMDQKRKKAADKIIQDMTDKGHSQTDIKIQQKTNKKMFGHEGEPNY